MAYPIQKLPDEPIIVQTLDRDFSFATEGKDSVESAVKLLGEQLEPAFYIVDLLDASLSLEDVFGMSNLAIRQLAQLKNPNMRECIVVTQSQVIELALTGLKSPMFGSSTINAFGTLDEAYAYARQAISASSQANRTA